MTLSLRTHSALPPPLSAPPAVKRPDNSFDLKAVSYIGRLARNLTEPSTFIGMVAAGALFRLVNVAALTGLTSSGIASFWTKSFGAQVVAGLTAFGVEGAAFPVATHLAAKVSGRKTDWNSASLASSYIFLGSVRAAGLAGGALSGWMGARTVLPKILVQQGALLGGIHLAHEVERARGVLGSVGPLSLADSLATLVHFNVAGPLQSKILGQKFVAWERSMDARAKQLVQGIFPSNPATMGLAHGLALANGGTPPPRLSPSFRIAEELGPTKTLMSKRSEDNLGSKYDQSGIQTLRPLTKVILSKGEPVSHFIRRWIEEQPHPIAVAKHENRFVSLPEIIMINRHFETVFKWSESALRGRSVGELFVGASLTFSRIISNLTGVMLNRPVEFDPSPLAPKRGDGDTLPCIGAGLYLKFDRADKTTYAFGIFTDIAAQTTQGRPVTSSPVLATMRPPPMVEPPSPRPPLSQPPGSDQRRMGPGVEHFRKVSQALQAIRVETKKKGE